MAGIDPIKVVDRVRLSQGRSPINPYTIDGFGPNDPPAPEYGTEEKALLDEMYKDADAEAKDWGSDDSHVAAGVSETPPSPLIPRGVRQDSVAKPQAVPQLPDLSVLGPEAQFHGQYVILDPQDQQAIGVLILRAAQRKITAQLNEASGKGPKPEEKPAEQKPKKKRGRPKGSLNKKKPPIPETPEPTDATDSP